MKISTFAGLALVFTLGFVLALASSATGTTKGQAKQMSTLDKQKKLKVAVVDLAACIDGTLFYADIQTRVEEAKSKFDDLIAEAEKSRQEVQDEYEQKKAASGEINAEDLADLYERQARLKERVDDIKGMRSETGQAVAAKYFETLMIGVVITLKKIAEDRAIDLVFKKSDFDLTGKGDNTQIGAFTRQVAGASLLYFNGLEENKAFHTIIDITEDVNDELRTKRLADMQKEIDRHRGHDVKKDEAGEGEENKDAGSSNEDQGE